MHTSYSMLLTILKHLVFIWTKTNNSLWCITIRIRPFLTPNTMHDQTCENVHLIIDTNFEAYKIKKVCKEIQV